MGYKILINDMKWCKTHKWPVLFIGTIGGTNQNIQNMKPRKNSFKFCIRNKRTHIHSMLMSVSINHILTVYRVCFLCSENKVLKGATIKRKNVHPGATIKRNNMIPIERVFSL